MLAILIYKFILVVLVFLISLGMAAYSTYEALGNVSLASIGLMSFSGIVQFAPAFFGGLFWRRATATGAIAGIGAGFITWLYTLWLPSIAGPDVLADGLFGLHFLRPTQLFYLNFDPLTQIGRAHV